MQIIRRANDRGHVDNIRLARGSLNTHHTFSFGEYDDPEWERFRALRVLNDDVISPGAGFPTHPHRDMEIITWLLEGALEHKDSSGGGGVVRPGDAQRMSAGRGVTHSEFNASATEPAHLLQTWIIPRESDLGLPPSYEQKNFPESQRRGRLRLIASEHGRDSSVTLRADARIHAGLFRAGESARLALGTLRAGAPKGGGASGGAGSGGGGGHAWVHVARGSATINGQSLSAGDALGLTDEKEVVIEGLDSGARAPANAPANAPTDDAEVLVFELA